MWQIYCKEKRQIPFLTALQIGKGVLEMGPPSYLYFGFSRKKGLQLNGYGLLTSWHPWNSKWWDPSWLFRHMRLRKEASFSLFIEIPCWHKNLCVVSGLQGKASVKLDPLFFQIKWKVMMCCCLLIERHNFAFCSPLGKSGRLLTVLGAVWEQETPFGMLNKNMLCLSCEELQMVIWILLVLLTSACYLMWSCFITQIVRWEV